MKHSTLPCEQSRSSFFPQLHRAIQIKKNKQKNKTKQNKKTLPNVANGHFERAASQVPSSKPKRPHFGGGDNKWEVWHVCLCLSLQSPRGGWTHCYAFRGCLINMGWLADQPRCENKVCLSLSWGRWTYRTISCDLGRAVPSRLDYRLWEAGGLQAQSGKEVGDWNSKRPSKRLRGAQNVFTVLRAWNKQRRSMPITA